MFYVKKAPCYAATMLRLCEKGYDPQGEILRVQEKLIAWYPDLIWDLEEKVVLYIGRLTSRDQVERYFQEFLLAVKAEIERLENLPLRKKPSSRIIGLAIQELRKEKGLTQEALAEKAHLNSCFIRKLERGEVRLSNITLATSAGIAQALDIDIEDLLTLSIKAEPVAKEGKAIWNSQEKKGAKRYGYYP